jgi:GxxExxY protein
MADAPGLRMPQTRSDSALFDPDTYEIIGAAMAVHTELGHGFLEAVYKAALRVEFDRRGIAAAAEAALPIVYRGQQLPVIYRVDFLTERNVLVEVKALNAIGPVEQAQAINYLKASGKTRALILNFGTSSLEHRRVVLNHPEQIIRR